MLRVFRSSRLSTFTLAAFLIAQPVVGCALVCLLDHHHGLHEMVGMTGRSASSDTACHTGVESGTPHGPAQTLSFMETAAPLAPPRAVTRSVQLPDVRPTAAPEVVPSLDPPPPRLV